MLNLCIAKVRVNHNRELSSLLNHIVMNMLLIMLE